MPIEYSCFISYPHGKGKALEAFIKEFVAALSDEIDVQTRKEIWVDYKRLEGGFRFNEKIAADLCKAACMITIYTPLYFDREHTYCAREFKAMERLEKERRRKLEDRMDPSVGLIIPIVLRGWDDFPKTIRDERQVYNFEEIDLADSELKLRRLFAPKFKEMARYIIKCCKTLETLSEQLKVDICGGCGGFALPSDLEAQQFIESLTGREVPQVGVSFVNRP
ncbi:MAG TPA: toll/interleukin-1 receptor domain-containing protein [Blastocatellia bacterium]|nr:toll/interleukin-1 receptor domain-containing protein [Blastocatellia bacterium]